MKIPERKISIKVKDNTYDLEVNTGTLIDIELMKMSLTNGQYANLARSSTSESLMARYNVDMIASINVLAPNLIKDLKVTSIANLDPVDGKILLDVYVKQLSPWLMSWLTFQNSSIEEEEDGQQSSND